MRSVNRTARFAARFAAGAVLAGAGLVLVMSGPASASTPAHPPVAVVAAAVTDEPPMTSAPAEALTSVSVVTSAPLATPVPVTSAPPSAPADTNETAGALPLVAVGAGALLMVGAWRRRGSHGH